MPDPGTTMVEYSYAVQVKEVLQLPFPLAVNMTYDAFWRAAYNKANEALTRQASTMFERGYFDKAQCQHFVEVQRNGLVKEFRKPLTPFGKLYSEILKPLKKLPTLDGLIDKKGSLEAVMRSIGSTRPAVNRIAIVARVAGPTMIGIEIIMTGMVIRLAPAEQKARVAAREGGGLAGSLAVGGFGMWAGCAALSQLVAPSLLVPVYGPAAVGAACLVGGVLGGVGMGALGRWAGGELAESVHDATAEWQWL